MHRRGGIPILPLTSAEHAAIAGQLGIPPSSLDVRDVEGTPPGHVVRLFGMLVADPETGHPTPEIRMIRVYVLGRRAFVEWRRHPGHGFSPWTIVCPDPDISERAVTVVWKARHLAFDASVRDGRPSGPTPGSEVEYWLASVDAVGLKAAKAEYDAVTPRSRDRYRWWDDNILRTLRRRKHRQ